MASDDDERRSTLPTSTDAAPTSTIGFDALPNDVIVSIFEKLLAEPEFVLSPYERWQRRSNNLRWVRETFPLVCRRWRDLYWSRDASPLHETLEVDFTSEGRHAAPRLIVRAERVLAWARRHASDVRTLRARGRSIFHLAPPGDFTSENFATLVEILAPSLTTIEVGERSRYLAECRFWDALREHVAPRGQLRKLAFDGVGVYLAEGDALVRGDVDVSFLGQLTSLEELRLDRLYDFGLRAFPASVLSLTRLRRLSLRGHEGIASLPAGISTLRGLEDLDLTECGLRSLPEELSALTRLTKLDLEYNSGLGRSAGGERDDVVFPDALRGLKSLRHLQLDICDLQDFPAFIGELEALEHLDLACNRGLGDGAPWAPFAEPSPLTYLDLYCCCLTSVPAAVLSSMPRLRVLDLSDNSLTSLPDNLGEQLPELREIKVAFDGFETVAPLRALAGASSLEKIGFTFRRDPSVQVEESLDFLLETFPRLREVVMTKDLEEDELDEDELDEDEWTPASRAHLERFAERLKERDPTAVVRF